MKTKKTKKTFGGMVKTAKKNRDQDRPTDLAPHVIVKALAGTGKTFTLVMALVVIFWDQLQKVARQKLGFTLKLSPQQEAVAETVGLETPRTATYIAFNRSIVEEFKVKWAWVVEALASQGVTFGFSTIHQLGFRAVQQSYRLNWRDINKWRTRNFIEEVLGRDTRELIKTDSGRVLVEAVEGLVDKARLTLAHNPTILEDEDRVEVDHEVLEDLAIHFGINLGEQADKIFPLVNQILDRMRTDPQDLDFTDMIWLPVVNRLRVFQSDLLLVDEGQDLNRCQQTLALMAGRRIILCGDQNQAIYGFAGADTDSIPTMKARLEATDRGVVERPLTVTRRCGKAIVNEVLDLVPDFQAHEGNPDGLVRWTQRSTLMDELTDQDMVLTRTNAPGVGLAFELMKDGRKVNIQGRDLAKNLKGLIKTSGKKDVDGFLEWLDKYQDQELARLMKRKRKSEEAIISLKDKVVSLRIFAEGATTLKEVQDRIDRLFKGKKCPKCRKDFDGHLTHCPKCKVQGAPVVLVKPEGVLISSVHRAKGLESDRVFILNPHLFPHPMAKTKEAVRQEYHLQYVARTRAIQELVYVEDDTSGQGDF